MKKYRVFLVATLPASTTMEIDAENIKEATEIAEREEEYAEWDGADYSRPHGCDISIDSIEEI